MHFITGGAYNGKRAWVKKTYGLQKTDSWLSAYENHQIPENVAHDRDFLILEGIEIWLKLLTEKDDIQQSRNFWNRYLDNWLEWEREKADRSLIVIGTDITKGIVPLEKENRIWRDLTGWAFQDTAAKAEKVDIIWYGLNITFK
ncbi:bifunctional adenosylcobinamide kinase/adenosylcobinamide-phosphate guanylyltransferase [Bacillus sp. USDA818B3_A]|uniref:bifunctional adenosylcobinamide kinase/adenosylcobinamide-phosphate guanylyltransferase n=1 Tax=Bacillus sp. USDA818B3_A TaxID=2698834 RepID=UPI001371A9A2|nr:bifunctional adenosylcobinamide kinase/adenosylcobinamide-phosphate guanylyltransferase [Bacillus sp. USDA818B3_A]